jgi:hypothetical protein
MVGGGFVFINNIAPLVDDRDGAAAIWCTQRLPQAA